MLINGKQKAPTTNNTQKARRNTGKPDTKHGQLKWPSNGVECRVSRVEWNGVGWIGMVWYGMGWGVLMVFRLED